MEEQDLALDPRHVARALALQQLFTLMEKEGDEQRLFESTDLLEVLESGDYDKELYSQLLTGLTNKETTNKIDAVIAKLAPSWPIDQIFTIDLITLRMGIWEGFVGKLTPVKVVINECIELAKEFGGENSGSFVNGVLGSLLEKEDFQAELPEYIKTEAPQQAIN